ncbi:hypothetical protein CISIN_1g0447081mg, partial [Citrus sinensis]
ASVFMLFLQIYLINGCYINSCREYWEKRLQIERVERVKQAKEYWENQCRAFMGI